MSSLVEAWDKFLSPGAKSMLDALSENENMSDEEFDALMEKHMPKKKKG